MWSHAHSGRVHYYSAVINVLTEVRSIALNQLGARFDLIVNIRYKRRALLTVFVPQYVYLFGATECHRRTYCPGSATSSKNKECMLTNVHLTFCE